MTKVRKLGVLIGQIKECLDGQKDIQFAYLYGSTVHDPNLPGGDIDVAVYLTPAKPEKYSKREVELLAILVSKLHTDAIDLRILNMLPLVIQYGILKEGILVLSHDETRRTEFETSVMLRFFELKPCLDEYQRMLSQRIRGV
jgi:predicted nucleotidyltransferase